MHAYVRLQPSKFKNLMVVLKEHQWIVLTDFRLSCKHTADLKTGVRVILIDGLFVEDVSLYCLRKGS